MCRWVSCTTLILVSKYPTVQKFGVSTIFFFSFKNDSKYIYSIIINAVFLIDKIILRGKKCITVSTKILSSTAVSSQP